MDSTRAFSFFFLLSSPLLFLSGFISATQLQELPMGAIDGSSLCMMKLLPCKDYLKPSSTPPSSCCDPLVEMISSNSECLCQVINDPDMFKSFNVSEEAALALTKTCGTDFDPSSACKKEKNSTGNSSNSFLDNLVNGTGTSNATGTPAPSSSTPTSAAFTIISSYRESSVVLLLFVASFISTVLCTY